MNYRYFMMIAIVYASTIVTVVPALTFNITLDETTVLDIYVSKTVLTTDLGFFSYLMESANMIARYSIFMTLPGIVQLRSHIDNNTVQNIDFVQLGFLEMPHEVGNPFSIELGADDLRNFMGDVSQVYVTIRQTQYQYNSLINAIQFFKYQFLKPQEFVPLGAVITVQASGLIAPEKFDLVPVQLRSKYPIASGLAI